VEKLRLLAAVVETRRAADAEIAAGRYAEAANHLSVAVEALRRLTPGWLPSEPKSRKLGTMDAQESNRGASVAAARTKDPLPFQLALFGRNSSVPQWAEAKGLEVEKVKSWVKRPKKGGRRIPREWALKIAREFVDPVTGQTLVPADESSWPSGIKD